MIDTQASNSKAGRLKQSVARWCFADLPIESFCEQLRDMGITGIDLADESEWSVCKRYGITPCMIFGGGSFKPPAPGSKLMFGPSIGWNKISHHAELIAEVQKQADLAVANGLTNIIALFGDREDMSDEEGIENCLVGLRQIVPYLEERGVNLLFELLNSKVDHLDYQGDNTAFGLEVCKRIGSERVKLIFDAYHMQIMEGSVINTLRENIEYIAHIQVAGVPGRNEIDGTQDVNWHEVAEAIADLNFSGYVAHEWIPTAEDPMAALRQAVKIMTV